MMSILIIILQITKIFILYIKYSLIIKINDINTILNKYTARYQSFNFYLRING